jgi:hypothetical protein
VSPVVKQELSTERAPSLRLPLKYILAAVVSFIALNIVILATYQSLTAFYFRNPPALLASHLFTLGWVTLVIMGSMYQLVPVILQAAVYSELLGNLGFWVFVAGLLGLLTGFMTLQTGLVALSGTLLVLASYAFLYNMARTLMRTDKWNLSGTYIVLALLYFGATVTWGLVLALNLRLGFLPGNPVANLGVHASLGLLGWFTLTIIGVGYKLIPMFALAHDRPETLARVILVVFNIGALGLIIAQLAGASPGIITGFLLVVLASILLFVYDMCQVFRTRRRRRLDLTMLFGAASIVYVGASVLLGLGGYTGIFPGIFPDQTSVLAFAYLALQGWVSTMIMGQLLKIVPFLIWNKKYAPKVGLEPVPLLREMFSERLGSAVFWIYNLGLLAFTAGVWLKVISLGLAGAAAVATASFLFGWVVLDVLRR